MGGLEVLQFTIYPTQQTATSPQADVINWNKGVYKHKMWLPWDQTSNDMKAFHATTATWTLQKWKPKMISRVRTADNDITEAELRKVGLIGRC